MQPLRIIFVGSGEFGCPTLRGLATAGRQIVQVFTQPDRPAGRGKKLTPTAIALLSENLHLPVIRTSNINAEMLPPADIMIVIAFGQKIAAPAVNHARLGSINLHASLLPKYRGAAPINWSIINGEKIAGNSVIRLAEKMDSGAILDQSELAIAPAETAGELHDRLAIDGFFLIQRVLEGIIRGNLTEHEQDHTLATLAPKLSRETAAIDWSQPADKIASRINGLSPWPGCRVRVLNPDGSEIARVTLLRADSNDVAGSDLPATLAHSGDIRAGDGRVVRILTLQPDGKRPMSLNDYRRGNRWLPGVRVESI